MIDIASKPVLITGVAGFLGTAVVERLRGQGLLRERHDGPEPSEPWCRLRDQHS